MGFLPDFVSGVIDVGAGLVLPITSNAIELGTGVVIGISGAATVLGAEAAGVVVDVIDSTEVFGEGRSEAAIKLDALSEYGKGAAAAGVGSSLNAIDDSFGEGDVTDGIKFSLMRAGANHPNDDRTLEELQADAGLVSGETWDTNVLWANTLGSVADVWETSVAVGTEFADVSLKEDGYISDFGDLTYEEKLDHLSEYSDEALLLAIGVAASAVYAKPALAIAFRGLLSTGKMSATAVAALYLALYNGGSTDNSEISDWLEDYVESLEEDEEEESEDTEGDEETVVVDPAPVEDTEETEGLEEDEEVLEEVIVEEPFVPTPYNDPSIMDATSLYSTTELNW